jgi:hypothetical protein
MVCLLLKSPAARAERHDIPGFEQIPAKQQSEVWCWAAVLQAVARAQGVELSQEKIVQDTKGHLVFQTASFDEITSFLKRGWVVPPGQPGAWTIDTLDYQSSGEGSMSRQFSAMLMRYFDIGRPAIVGYRTDSGNGHVLVAFGGDFGGPAVKHKKAKRAIGEPVPEPTSIPLLQSIRLFDPQDGTVSDQEWGMFSPVITGVWFPTISLRDGHNIF